MHFDIGSHSKARTRSVQLERGLDLVVKGLHKAESMKDAMGTPPVPNARSSSLPNGKENSGSIRHYRSMLDVEGPPKLGPVVKFTYDELYVASAKLQNSQPSHLPSHPTSSFLHLMQNGHNNIRILILALCSIERCSRPTPSAGFSRSASQRQAYNRRRPV